MSVEILAKAPWHFFSSMKNGS